MIALTIRTDKPEAEVGLYDDERQLVYEVWQAHRQLAETIHKKIEEVLTKANKNLKDIEGIIVYQGPGSFTGLRIGLSVANALAYGLEIPMVGETGAWIEQGIARLAVGQNDKWVVPDYGAPAHVTQQKK